MDRDEIRELSAEAVEDGVKRAFLTVGIDISEPKATIEVQQDMQHLRGWREATDAVKRQSLIGLAVLLASGLAGAVWIAVKRSAQ